MTWRQNKQLICFYLGRLMDITGICKSAQIQLLDCCVSPLELFFSKKLAQPEFSVPLTCWLAAFLTDPIPPDGPEAAVDTPYHFLIQSVDINRRVRTYLSAQIYVFGNTLFLVGYYFPAFVILKPAVSLSTSSAALKPLPHITVIIMNKQ